jgi:hypothetical protein
MNGHNPSVASLSPLALSAVARSTRNATARVERRCRRCGAAFTAARETAVWCSGACRVAAHRAELAGRPVAKIAPAAGLPGAAGAVTRWAAELATLVLLVAAILAAVLVASAAVGPTPS